jgi:hypothetical protein
MRIRRGAPLESPHILLLIDDPERSVVEPLAPAAAAGKLRELYATELMLKGGSVRGWAVDDAAVRDAFFAAVAHLADPEVQHKKYGEGAAQHPLVYAVGDGNHSLATAKQTWEERKAAGDDPETSPARYALVELCNVHDDALIFEPIHRVFEGARAADVLQRLCAQLHLTVEEMPADQVVHRVLEHGNNTPHRFGWVCNGKAALVTVPSSDKTLVVAAIQPAIDAAVKETGVAIDYVHGEDVVLAFGTKGAHYAGIVLPPMRKVSVFILLPHPPRTPSFSPHM